MKINWLSVLTWLMNFIAAVCSCYGGQPCYTGHCYSRQNYYSYKSPAYYPPQVKVVNNLIGVPVPVPYVAPIAATGQTIYGYSLKGYNFANEIDLKTAFEQAARATTQAQELAGLASKDFNNNLQLAIEGHTKIAEYTAKRDAIIGAWNALESPTSSAVSLRLSRGTDGKMQVEEETEPAERLSLKNVLNTKCASCHNGAMVSEAPGGELKPTAHNIDLSKYAHLSEDLKDIVVGRIETDMPKGGPKLTRREKAVFFSN